MAKNSTITSKDGAVTAVYSPVNQAYVVYATEPAPRLLRILPARAHAETFINLYDQFLTPEAN